MKADETGSESGVPVRFVLGHAELPAVDDSLVAGDVVELDSAAGGYVEVYAGERLVARGEAVWVGGCWGVRVRELCGACRPEAGANKSQDGI